MMRKIWVISVAETKFIFTAKFSHQGLAMTYQTTVEQSFHVS